MLVPAAVLVLFVLGSIAVDSSLAFMAQRELTSAAAAAANDAAGAALSDDAFYGGGTPGQVLLDQAAAEEVARIALDKRAPLGLTDVVQRVIVSGEQVCVVVTGRVGYIFAKAIPGGPRSRVVTGRAVATAVQGRAGSTTRGASAGACGP